MQTPTIHAAITQLFTERVIFPPHADAEPHRLDIAEPDASHDFLIVSARPDLLPDAIAKDDFVSSDGVC